VTPEGLEFSFALNHMAYFLLTAALRDKLAVSAPSRVVSTASNAHQAAKLDLNDLQSARDYSGWRAYARSKLANILFTRELAQPSRRNRRQRQLPPPWLRRIALRRLGWRPDKLDDAARQIFCDLVSEADFLLSTRICRGDLPSRSQVSVFGRKSVAILWGRPLT
jgi:hypothetical protein